MATGDNDHSAPAGSAASVQPTNTYVLLITLFGMWLFCHLHAIVLVDLFYIIISMHIMAVIWIKLILKMPNIPAIQKPYMLWQLLIVSCPNYLRHFSMTGFAAALKQSPFTGMHFKRWQTKTILWLTAMNVYWVAEGMPG
jgi:hypothetical protein